LSVVFLEVPEDPRAVTRDLPFDYVWFTSRAPTPDPCAAPKDLERARS
jgi:hypothetical protein